MVQFFRCPFTTHNSHNGKKRNHVGKFPYLAIVLSPFNGPTPSIDAEVGPQFVSGTFRWKATRPCCDLAPKYFRGLGRLGKNQQLPFDCWFVSWCGPILAMAHTADTHKHKHTHTHAETSRHRRGLSYWPEDFVSICINPIISQQKWRRILRHVCSRFCLVHCRRWSTRPSATPKLIITSPRRHVPLKKGRWTWIDFLSVSA